MFKLHNITSEGKRGRPAHPKAHAERTERVLSAKGAELGEVHLEAQTDGSVLLTAVIDGKSRKITFPAKAAKRGRKAQPQKATPRKRTRKAA